MLRGTPALEIDDPKILTLRKQVAAAQQEFDMAVAFHEVWKPAAYDKDLHSRLGTSYATQAFLVARTALRREMLLALTRLWDTTKPAIRMTLVRDMLRDKDVIEALAFDRAKRGGWLEVLDAMTDDLKKKADEAVWLLNEYIDGTRRTVLSDLLTLRNEQLAHHQLAKSAMRPNTTDDEIEKLYQDHSKLIKILLGVVNATAYDPQDTARVFGLYAGHFWKRVT